MRILSRCDPILKTIKIRMQLWYVERELDLQILKLRQNRFECTVITEIQNAKADCFSKKVQNALPSGYIHVVRDGLTDLQSISYALLFRFFRRCSTDEMKIGFKDTETEANFIFKPHR